MKAICGGFWLVLFLHFCLHASQSTRNHRSKRLSSSYCNSNADCKNGGQCELDSCRCPYGYMGNFCEIRLQCTNDSDCFRRGKCDLDRLTNTTFCNCDQSNGRYEGVFCEKRLPCHASGYCLNDGLCQRDSVATNLFYCQCTEGFTGSNCQEKTFCQLYDSCNPGGTCQYSYNFRKNACLCDKRTGYTGYFCKLRITPALDYSARFHWSFNRKIPEAKGAAKVVRDSQMGNVISLERTGGGFVDLGDFRNSCMNNDFNTCQQGISLAFWLQFNDGVFVLSITKANTSVLSVQVSNDSKLLVELQSGSNLWKIQRDCFPVGWFYVTVTWNNQKMMYYENGQLLSQYSAPVPVNMSLPQEASLLSVGSYKGLGGFSTMRISNLAFWTHALSKQEIKQMYLKKFSSPFTTRCLLNTCPSNQWCEDDSSKSSNFTCIEPTGFYCSFNSGYCQWRNASIKDHPWQVFSRYGSLRHDHTGNVCGGRGQFLGLVSHGQLRSEVISRKFQNQSNPRRKVSLSMWYYMEGLSEKIMSIIVLWNSTANETLLNVKKQQSRRWNYLKTEFSANTSFQIILHGELLGSGGIFVDDISLKTFNVPVILSQKRNYSTNLQNTTVMDCVAAYSVNITWYREKKPIKQGNHYVIKQGDLANKLKVSSLEVKDANCEVAGNYACVAVSDHGTDQQQFTITILDLPRMPSNLRLDPSSKQITWTEDPRYQCLPKSHFVVEYKKSSSSTWTTAGYFDNKTFDLVNSVKGKQYDVRVYAMNSVGRSRGRKKSFFTNIEPSNIHFLINHMAIKNTNTVFVESGVPVNLRCQVTAEPKPIFTLRLPGLTSVMTFSPLKKVRDVKWECSLRIRSMSCRNTGFFSCMAYNLLGNSKVFNVTLQLSAPDPPKTFRAAFVNITSVVITWSAYKCNGMVKPSTLSVRFRQEGHKAWIERNYTNPAEQITIIGQFWYGTTYEFIGRLVYDSRVGVFCPIVKTPSPDLSGVAVTTHFTGQTGTAMAIYCTAEGPAALIFSWKKDHVALRPSYWLKMDQYNSTCSVLTIRSTKEADSGNYTCTVSKSGTSIKETVFVRAFQAPKVAITPLVRTLFEGESVTFHCDLLRGSTSQLSVAWYEKAENSQEAPVHNNNDSLSLTVGGLPNAAQTHVTYYRCTVQNTDGIGSSPLAKLVVLHKEDTAVCKQEVYDGITWSLTSPGVSDIQRCPNAIGHAVRPCLSTDQSKEAKWGQVDFSDCISRQIIALHEEVLRATEGYIVNRNLRTMLEDLENVTAVYSAPLVGQLSRRMYGRDLKACVDTLAKLIKYNAANGTKPLSTQHDMKNLVKTSSNLLRLANLPAWKTALKIQDDVAYQMVLALDEYGHHSTLKTNDFHIATENIVLVTVKVPVNSSEATNGLHITQGQNSLDLPSTLFSQTNNTVTIVSVFFSTLGHVITSTEAHGTLNTSLMNDWFLNSKLASITIRPTTPDVIEPPFKLALETPKATPVSINRACVFLNITAHLSRTRNNTWSTRGCHVVSSRTNSTTTTCACDHMTLFAVLMDSGGDQLLYSSHLVTLSWVSVVGCLLSLVGIAISVFVTFCFWKNLRSQRTVVLINLCVAIALTDALVVAMEIADVQNRTSCTVLAAFLHFFVLSIFCWMLSEGVQLYFSLVKIIGANSDINIRIFYGLGWGLPSFVVSVSLAATQGRGYANMQTCWLNSRNYVLWAFVAPALLIVSVNMVIFALVLKSMLSSHRLRKEPLARRFQRGLKASFVLLPLLGISWSFGVLTLVSDKIVFNYIFAISNSLQGLLIFVFHCVLNKQIRDALSERKRRRARLLTDAAITGQSNRKLSTTTDMAQGTCSHHSSATGLRLLSLQLFRSEVCPSPQPSTRISQAFEETALGSVEASPVISCPEHTNLLPTKRPTTGVKIQEKGTTDHAKDEALTQPPTCTSNTSSNGCDMDERDMTSSESSFEMIEYRGQENPLRRKAERPSKESTLRSEF